MDKKTVEWLIAQGEGYNLEFKEAFSQNIAREMCGFANANGGKILLGVSDNGTVKGIRRGNDMMSRLQDIARNIDPPVSISMEYVEKIGSGILRINREMEEYGLPGPEIDTDGDWFSITFRRPDLQKESFEERRERERQAEGSEEIQRDGKKGVKKGVERGVEKGVETLSRNQKLILEQIRNNPKISKREIQDTLGLGKKAVDYNIEILKKMEVLKRVGPARGGHWEVVDDE